jgi:signal transduction histidine kinase
VDPVLEIQITDDGRGFQTDDLVRSKRHGLPNMRARVEQLGGRFEVSSRPGRGTVIRVVILAWRDARAEPRPPH